MSVSFLLAVPGMAMPLTVSVLSLSLTGVSFIIEHPSLPPAVIQPIVAAFATSLSTTFTSAPVHFPKCSVPSTCLPSLPITPTAARVLSQIFSLPKTAVFVSQSLIRFCSHLVSDASMAPAASDTDDLDSDSDFW